MNEELRILVVEALETTKLRVSNHKKEISPQINETSFVNLIYADFF